MRLTFFDLRTEKTAAASVEEIMEPRRKPYSIGIPRKVYANTPMRRAVASTPNVERPTAGARR